MATVVIRVVSNWIVMRCSLLKFKVVSDVILIFYTLWKLQG